MRVQSVAILCALVGIAVYSNTLYHDFVYDDIPAVIKNKDLLPESSWSSLVWHDFWGTVISHSSSHKSYRPLTVASFKLNYLFSGLESSGYHLVNIVLHGIV